MSKSVYVNVRLDPETKVKLYALADEIDISKSKIIRKSVIAFLKKSRDEQVKELLS